MNSNFYSHLRLLQVFLCFGFLVLTPALAMQGALQKDTVVDRVIQAYGGKKLLAMKSLEVHDRYKVFSMDQGPNPEMNSVSLLYSTLTIDFGSTKKSVKSWRQGVNGNRLSEILFDGKTGWSINHLRGTYVENKNLNSNVVGAGMIRMIDTILVRLLEQKRDTATLISFGSLAGKEIVTLSFEAEKETRYFLDIDASTWLILRMSRNRERATGQTFEFGRHKEVKGITFATDMNMLVDGKPRFIINSRNIEVNQSTQESFKIPKNSFRLKGMIDRSKMTVKKLADKVYLAGEGSNFSIFVDAGDSYIGGGGLPGMKKRLKAVNQYLGDDKSISIQIIPDHHRGHLGAIKELEEIGSRMVVASQHRSIIESLRLSNHQNDDLIEVSEKTVLANGLVEVYDIETSHADNYLLFYVPSAKLVFSADHFGTAVIDALPGANNNSKTFHREIERLGLDVESYAGAHSPRVLSAEDMQQVLSGYQVRPCPLGHPICID